MAEDTVTVVIGAVDVVEVITEVHLGAQEVGTGHQPLSLSILMKENLTYTKSQL